MDPENGRSTPFWTNCERQRHGDFIAGTVVIQCALTNRCSRVAITHLNVGNFSANNERAPVYHTSRARKAPQSIRFRPPRRNRNARPLSILAAGGWQTKTGRGSVLPSNLLSSCSPGTTHDYAIGRAGPSILSSVAPHAHYGRSCGSP